MKKDISINWNRYSYKVNTDFFKRWGPKMAYVLGFTFADGNVYKTSLAWDLKDDKELLYKIHKAMESTYPIQKRKASFRLRINNPVLIQDLDTLGLYPNKTRNCKFPNVPKQLLNHFARGFLDGDGWISIREKKQEITVGFSNGSLSFLKNLALSLKNILLLNTARVRKRTKVTKRDIIAITYQADYYSSNAYGILKFLYDNLKKDDLFMKRKYKKQLKARELYEYIHSGDKKWREIERKFKISMQDLLHKLLLEKKLNGVQIAQELNVHSSSIYRWLERTGIRLPIKRK